MGGAVSVTSGALVLSVARLHLRRRSWAGYAAAVGVWRLLLLAERERAAVHGSLLVVVRSGSLERRESAIVGYRIDADGATRVLAV